MTEITAFDDSASSAGLVTAALDALVQEVADADDEVRMYLSTCQRCRNNLLYLLDTAPYTGQAARQFRSRLRALADGGQHEHHDTSRPGPHADSAIPQIRGIA